MGVKRLLKNYQFFPKSSFKALALDIDGTLTGHDGDIHPWIFDSLLNILNNRIPVALITGRNLHQKSNFRLLEELFRRKIFLYHSAAAVGRITNSGQTLLKRKETTSVQKLINLITPLIKKPLCIKVSAYKAELFYDNVTYSQATHLIKQINTVCGYHFKNIKSYLSYLNKLGSSIIITENPKSSALIHFAKYIKEDVNKILTIGDMGCSIGYDYSMLKWEGGICVGKQYSQNDIFHTSSIDLSLVGWLGTKYILSSVNLSNYMSSGNFHLGYTQCPNK